MTRHARNCTAGAVYTYHEKKRDAAESGYGSCSQRVGKDSVVSFDCCNLTLQPCRDPVITADGYIFDKEAILKYILSKKSEHQRLMKEYAEQQKRLQDKEEEARLQEKQDNLNKFMDTEKNIVNQATGSGLKRKADTEVAAGSSVSNMISGKNKQLPSFWVPSQLPDAKRAKIEMPNKQVKCPITGKPLKMKDLVDVKWTLVKDPDDNKSLIAKQNRYMCPVTHDVLGNNVACVLLSPTGDVITEECYNKLVKKDMVHPLTGEKLKPEQVIKLQRGGTGYSTTNQQLQGTTARPVLQA